MSNAHHKPAHGHSHTPGSPSNKATVRIDARTKPSAKDTVRLHRPAGKGQPRPPAKP